MATGGPVLFSQRAGWPGQRTNESGCLVLARFLARAGVLSSPQARRADISKPSASALGMLRITSESRSRVSGEGTEYEHRHVPSLRPRCALRDSRLLGITYPALKHWALIYRPYRGRVLLPKHPLPGGRLAH